SLSDEQRQDLEGITCDVTPEYRDFIRSALGAHGHGNLDFNRFCEAQLVWDTAMAINALDYLNRHPGRTMVLLAGSGHARKMGIPYQFSSRSRIPFAVLLPLTPDIFEPATLTPADADFIVMP
ncbi:MAG TPA: ChaN family lipoprotein, partial [Desulfosarcina sp.]|nr:ChaN family lipoprotein [Desulfosarcina sp.]